MLYHKNKDIPYPEILTRSQNLKNKMFEPLSGVELHQSIKNVSRPLTTDRKEVKEDNLSLF